MRLLLFIAVFLWYYDPTFVDECFLKSAAVTQYGNYMVQTAIMIRHRQMLSETELYTIFRQYRHFSAILISGMAKDALQIIMCKWYFRPVARERLSSGFFATLVAL